MRPQGRDPGPEMTKFDSVKILGVYMTVSAVLMFVVFLGLGKVSGDNPVDPDIVKYVRDTFGPKKVLYSSNWPVVELDSTFATHFQLMLDTFGEDEDFFENNLRRAPEHRRHQGHGRHNQPHPQGDCAVKAKGLNISTLIREPAVQLTAQQYEAIKAILK